MITNKFINDDISLRDVTHLVLVNIFFYLIIILYDIFFNI